MAVSTNDDKKYFDSQLLSYILEKKHAEAQSLLGAATADDLENSVDASGATLLHYAAQYGNTVMTKYLIDMGCEIDALDESGRPPLMLALTSDHVDTIAVLLAANADVNIRDNLGRTILESVLQPGAVTRSPDVVDLFLARVIHMCADDDTAIAEKLTEVGCNLVKAITLDRPGVTRAMLEKGCSVEDRDVHCNTTLHVAVERMNLDNVKLLVRHGARVNARGCHGRTPLLKYNMFAETAERLEILKFLLDEGASLTTQDLFGITPMSFFLCGGDRQTLEIIMKYDVELHGLNRFHQNPLHYLVDNRNPGVLEALRGKSFDVDSRNPQGFTPLMLAAKNYDSEKIEFLLEHGADVNARSLEGHSALILLFMNRLEDERNIVHIVQLLLRHGAEAGAALEYTGKTVFDLAVENEFFYRVKSVISSLAMDESRGKPIGKLLRDKIDRNFVFKYHYEKCKEQIRRLRYKIVRGSVSLYKLLVGSERKLAMYARNREFEANFARLMTKVQSSNVDCYILDNLRRRVEKAIQITKLRESSALAICRVTALPISTYHTILHRIVDYLSNRDLETLRKV